MSVSIENIIKDLQLEVLVEGKSDIKLNVSDINRPGLQFAGFYDYFGNKRVQVIGMGEWSFLNAMRQEIRQKGLENIFNLIHHVLFLLKV